MSDYQIITDATADLSDIVMKGLPYVDIIPMPVIIGEREYLYGPGGNISVEEFYRLQKLGLFGSTSAVNPDTYMEHFEMYLKEGKDIIYLCFSSGLSSMIQSARLAIMDLSEKYPDRKIYCIDTLCASLGEGLLVIEAARKQQEGMTIDELKDWVNENHPNVCQWFSVDVFDHLQHGGRVSAVAAVAGSILQIKPLLHVDHEGNLSVTAKPRGRKKAVAMKLEQMENGWMPEISRTVIVGHGDCPEEAEQLKKEVKKRFKKAKIYIMDIGPVIGAHTGPGMLALVYWGNTR